MNKDFKNRQVAIFYTELKLADDTQTLLFDLLSAMTDEQRKKLNGYEISNYETIISINKEEIIYVDDFENELSASLEKLTQEQAKEIIDTIMSEIFKM